MSAVLEYALVDGRPVHARRFVGVETHLRPVGRCPCCDEVVVWKAGESGKVTPHVAHASGAACASTAPETAEHLNAKARLVELLSKRDHLDILARCARSHRVGVQWSGGWSTAVPEYRVRSRRPDVALLNADEQTVGAIEVRHTHAVDQKKAEDLAAAGVSWIEVTAMDVLRWDGVSPLDVVAWSEFFSNELTRVCGICAQYERVAEAQRLNALRRQHELDEANREAEERRRRLAEYPQRLEERQKQVEALRANPPRGHIAIAIAMEGNPGNALVGFVVMRPGRVPEPPCFIEGPVGSGEAAWLALDHALQWLERKAPGHGATFHTNVASLSFANLPRKPAYKSWDSDYERLDRLKQRVAQAVERTGSLVVETFTRSVKDPDSARWLIQLHEHLKRELRARQEAA